MTRLEVVSDPSGTAGERHLSQPRVVLGRGPDADWSFEDHAVSRRHAAIYHFPDHDEIEDLGSMAGTLVNGTRIDGQAHPASRRRRAAGVRAAALCRRPPGRPGDDAGHRSPCVHRLLRRRPQHAGVISNVGGNQYNNEYVQQIIVNRQEAFRQIAPMSRFARALFILGFSLAVSGVLGFIGSIMVMIATSNPDIDSPEAFEESTAPPELMGYPVFALAFGVALVGMALVFLGVIIQFTVSTRKKEVERRYPLPPGWGGHQS